MASMTAAERDRFLAEPRYGVLTYLQDDGSPLGVPVWFEWTGAAVRMFTSMASPKMKRLEHDPRASLVVSNHLDEHEAWVAFDGTVEIQESGGIELAGELAKHYWDLSDPARQQTLDTWRKAAAALRILELAPTRIRSYVD